MHPVCKASAMRMRRREGFSWLTDRALANVDDVLTFFGDKVATSCDRRPKVPGATVFVTVSLPDRSSRFLVARMGVLRRALMQTPAARPLVGDA